MQILIKCSNVNQETQPVFSEVSVTGINLLNDIQQRLYLAGDELQRMENEGGPALNEYDADKVYAYFRTSQRIRKALLFTQKMQLAMSFHQPVFRTH